MAKEMVTHNQRWNKDDLERVKEVAKNTGRTASGLIRFATMQFVEEAECQYQEQMRKSKGNHD